MNTIVIYETLTGNTAKAADFIAHELVTSGAAVTVCPTTGIDYQALSQAELVVLGTWVDGIFVVGQRPGRAARLRKLLPALAGKQAVAYCTYALDPGHTLNKMARILSDKGADPLGGFAINRRHLGDGAKEFVDRLAGAVSL